MRKLQVMVVMLVLAVGFAPCAMAKDAKAGSKSGKPGVVAVEVVKWSATVKSVDYVNKTAVLVDDKGRTVQVNAKNARNLDQVITGDKVKVKYIEELAVFVTKADAPPRAEAARQVALAPKGKMPGGIIVETAQVQADVQGVDYGKRTITLKGPAGEVRTYKVSKQVKRLKDIKKGDQVVLDVTQALALEVVKP